MSNYTRLLSIVMDIVGVYHVLISNCSNSVDREGILEERKVHRTSSSGGAVHHLKQCR